MRYVDRSLVREPASLAFEGSDGALERAQAAAYYAQVPEPEKSYGFRAYKNDDVKEALRAVSPSMLSTIVPKEGSKKLQGIAAIGGWLRLGRTFCLPA